MVSCVLCRQEVADIDALKHGPQEIKRFVEAGFRPAPEAIEPFRSEESETEQQVVQKWEDHLARGIGPYFLCPSCFEQAQQIAAKTPKKRPDSEALLVETAFEDAPKPPPNYRWPRPYVSAGLLLLLGFLAFWQAYRFTSWASEREAERDERREAAKAKAAKVEIGLDSTDNAAIGVYQYDSFRWFMFGLFLFAPGAILLAFLGLHAWLRTPPPPFNPETPHPKRRLIGVARGLALLAFVSFAMGVMHFASMQGSLEAPTWWEDDRVLAIVCLALAALYFVLFCLMRLPNAALFVTVVAQLFLVAFMYMVFHSRVLKYADVVLLEVEMGWAWAVLGLSWVLQLAAALCIVPMPQMSFINWNASRTCPICGRILREGATFCTFCKEWIR